MMAIKSDVFGSCVEEIDVSVELKNGDLLLWSGIKTIFNVIQSSLFTLMMATNGARYRMAFFALLGRYG